jgi:uracil-DNA glycosylase family protein
MTARNPYPTAAPFLPDRLSLTALRTAVQGCRGCPLFADATQAVFGQGRLKAKVMLVGEQPGDHEDLSGAPFVGPAGKLLDRALAEAGIERNETYVTNAVKHFKWKARGTRRIHDKPTWTEAMACRPWLDAELALVKPQSLVLLGATAAQALLGKSFKVTRNRGKPLDSELAELVVATIHPSAVLRANDREAAFAGLVGDLRVVSAFAA